MVAFLGGTRAASGAQPGAVPAFKGGLSSAFSPSCSAYSSTPPALLHPHLCPPNSFLMGEITFPTAGPKPTRPKIRDGMNAARPARAPRLEACQPAYVVPSPFNFFSHWRCSTRAPRGKACAALLSKAKSALKRFFS